MPTPPPPAPHAPPAQPQLRAAIVTVPGVAAADLDELAGALRDLGSAVETRVESPPPQMMLEWLLPAAIVFFTAHPTWALIAKSSVEGFFTKAGEHIYEGLHQALKGAKKRDYRFRTLSEMKQNAGGKAAPLLTLEIEIEKPAHAKKVKFIFPADLPEENWPAAIKTLLSASAPQALEAASHGPHPNEDGILVDDAGEEYQPPDYVYLPGRGWVNAYDALNQLIREGKV